MRAPFYDSIEEYYREEEMNWIEFMRALPRPFIVVSGWMLYWYCIIAEVAIPTRLDWVLYIITLYYFGERAVKSIKNLRG